MIEIKDKTECCGCSACASGCPVGAINMIEDGEGFQYPQIDNNKCVNCQKCENVCPVRNKKVYNESSRKVYICQNRDDNIRFDSTSGGAFSALAKYVIRRKGYVFGAEFNSEWKVVHGFVREYAQLSRFRGSKYVQSDIGDTFVQIKNLLDDDNWVLFTGTPCQVEGLILFLGKSYEKLVLMDIVCYSISSPKVWRMYLDHLETSRKIDLSKVKRIKFRDKSKYGYEYTLMTFYDKNNKIIYSSGPECNQMLRSFVSNTSTRPSCYNCQFKKIERNSDFTVWDCYNIYKYDRKLDDNKGSSHIMVHSVKAKKMLEELSEDLVLKQINIISAVESEPAMTESAKPSDLRVDFFECVQKNENVFNVYFSKSVKIQIESILRKMLSRIGVYKYIKRMIKNE